MSLRPSTDPALQALMLPFATDALAWPGSGALFLRARDGWPLHARATPGLVVEQEFKPDADALERAGFVRPAERTTVHPLVLLLPPRQREEMRTLFAHA